MLSCCSPALLTRGLLLRHCVRRSSLLACSPFQYNMNDSEINQQIKQMVQFIHQEANEKANEIKLKADEEFNIEKLRMVEAEKAKIRAEYERKEKQIEVQKRM
eukprot:scaffold12001_cov116-Isochrysis_galbana.AAC.10